MPIGATGPSERISGRPGEPSGASVPGLVKERGRGALRPEPLGLERVMLLWGRSPEPLRVKFRMMGVRELLGD